MKTVRPSTINDARYSRLTGWLKEKRKAQGVTTKQLAERLGCGNSLISKYERNHIRIDVLRYFEICKVLGINAAEGLQMLEE